MARKRRPFEVFSMSFLDCMSCGFGAVILFFMIINAQVKETTPEEDPTRKMAEVKKLEVEILEGRKDLVLRKNTLEDLQDETETTEGQIAEIIALIAELQAELAQYDNETLAKIERIEKLQSDIKSLEEEVKRLLALKAEEEEDGARLREFKGEGDRQYLTGLKLGGDRTLILVDRSASMLDDTIVNIIRRRNMATEDKLRAVKWRQVVASVDWLTSQFKPRAASSRSTCSTTRPSPSSRAVREPGSRPTTRRNSTRLSGYCEGLRPRTAPTRALRSRLRHNYRRRPTILSCSWTACRL